MIDVIITKFFPFAVLEWRNVLRIKIIFYVKDKIQKSLAEALNRFEKQVRDAGSYRLVDPQLL